MGKLYIIDEKRLVDLLTKECRLEVLERDGVDNWSWYMEGRFDYLVECGFTKEEIYEQDIDFEDVAIKELKNYKEV